MLQEVALRPAPIVPHGGRYTKDGAGVPEHSIADRAGLAVPRLPIRFGTDYSAHASSNRYGYTSIIR